MTQPSFRTAAAQAAAIGDSLCLRRPEGGDWIVLNGTARAIWEALEYPRTLDDLAGSLGARYEAPPGLIAEETARTVADLSRKGLVEQDRGPPADPVRVRYLSLLKRALANMLYAELELQIEHLEQGVDVLEPGAELQRFQRDIARHRPEALAALMAAKSQGMGSPRFPHTMIGLFRLTNIERCAEQVLADGVPGDFLEAGVCRGGAAIFMRALQIALGAPERRTWVVDSFEGVPPSDSPVDASYGLHLHEERLPWLACSEEAVRDNFQRYDLLDTNVRFLPGWIETTLPSAPTGPLAILRIDVDLYSSTATCLDLLYERVSPGGFVIVDDYGHLECCRDAVDHFRERRGVREPMHRVDGSGIYWRKEGPK